MPALVPSPNELVELWRAVCCSWEGERISHQPIPRAVESRRPVVRPLPDQSDEARTVQFYAAAISAPVGRHSVTVAVLISIQEMSFVEEEPESEPPTREESQRIQDIEVYSQPPPPIVPPPPMLCIPIMTPSGLFYMTGQQNTELMQRFRAMSRFLNLQGQPGWDVQHFVLQFGMPSSDAPFGRDLWIGMRGLLDEYNLRHPTRAVDVAEWHQGWFFPPSATSWGKANCKTRLSEMDKRCSQSNYAPAYPTMYQADLDPDDDKVQMKCLTILVTNMKWSWYVHVTRVYKA